MKRVPTSSDSPVSTTGGGAAAWSMPSSPTLRRRGEVSGSGVSEGVSEAPTFIFTEWSTMVVPTYPEGGSHALQVCQHHHEVVRWPRSSPAGA